ncbi:MAG: T9SS type A sorting domain-containing protein [Bacteroidetes bacterium]|nr:T9SS type A sorting domain-containing protein [Bacteroidota bacterium]
MNHYKIYLLVFGVFVCTICFAQDDCTTAIDLGQTCASATGGGAGCSPAGLGNAFCGCGTNYCKFDPSAYTCATSPNAPKCIGVSCPVTGNDVWFKFKVPAGLNTVDIEVSREDVTATVMNLKIYSTTSSCISGGCAGLSQLNCYSSSCSPGCGIMTTSGLTGGNCYFVRVIYDGANPRFSICIGKAVLLPIELLSFNAFPISPKELQVNWITATETNNDYFSIERSVDGINFSSIGTVKSAGNSSTQKTYSWIDTDPVVGTSYYRLKQTDFDGKFEIFNPVSVDFDPNNVEWMFVNPNLVSSSDKINLELTNLPSCNDISIHLYDLNGNAVYSNTLPLDVNGQGIITSLDVPSHLSSGMYALSVSCGNRVGVKKIVVQ